MAEAIAGLAVASSIITVVALTGKLLRIGWDCVKIYQDSAPEGMEKLVEELTLIHGLLTTLKTQFEAAKKAEGTQESAVETLLQQPGGMMKICALRLQEVATTLNEIVTQRGARLKSTVFTGHKSTKRLAELISHLERFKTCLLLALHSDQYTLAKAIQQHILGNIDALGTRQEEIKVAVAEIDGKVDNLVIEVHRKTEAERLMHQEKKARKALRWLDSPDHQANHSNARNLVQEGTGLWFLESPEFLSWSQSNYGALWLHAIPGAGKTILCSTIINRIKSQFIKEHDIAVVYFYFDFRDSGKQTSSGMLLSLIHQLALNLNTVPAEVLALYDKYKGEKVRPSVQELGRLFIIIARNYFKKVFVFTDALDECKQWESLLPNLEEFISSRSLILLMTSRNEHHISNGFQRLPINTISIDSTAVAQDVQLFVHEQIAAGPFLRELKPELKQDIINTLVQGAKGMFRWVKCQFDSIRGLRRPKAIRNALLRLPDTLDETYERILVAIKSDEERALLYRVLILIIYGTRPLTLSEVAEAAVIEKRSAGLDPEDRFTQPDDLFCGWKTLIIVTGGYLGLAHYSVQEYLKSDRICDNAAKFFAVSDREASTELTEICLTYLNYSDFADGPCQSDEALEERLSEYPFLDYAANSWFHHAKSESVQQSCLTLFDKSWLGKGSKNWLSWLQIFRDTSITLQRKFDTYLVTNPTPLYFTSLFGLKVFCERLLSRGHSANTQGGYFGNPLQAASVGQHVDVVELLLDHKADMNRTNGYHGTALQAAANGGSLEIAAMLLHRGADARILAGVYGNALQSAARNGRFELVDLILQHNVDVNAVGGPFGFALQAASNNGHWEIVDILLNHEAEVNSQGGAFGNALQAAALNGRLKAVEVLLARGAEVNFQGGLYSNALLAASLNGHEHVVKLLADHGADVNKQNGYYANALQAAAINGHDDVVGILLDYGADVHTKGGMGGSALAAAARNGYSRVVAQLLEHNPALDVCEGYYGSPLQAASRNGFTEVVKMLLDKGASASTSGGRYGNPLQAAASNGKIDIVKLLLQSGANVNQIGGPYHTALTAAAAFGHESVVLELLNAGADVKLAGGKFDNAMKAATLNNWAGVVQLLTEYTMKQATSSTRQDSAIEIPGGKPMDAVRTRALVKL